MYRSQCDLMFAVSNLYHHVWQPRVEKKRRREKGTWVKKRRLLRPKNKILYTVLFVLKLHEYALIIRKKLSEKKLHSNEYIKLFIFIKNQIKKQA